MVFSGFIFGLISSLHCIGMCGPIAMMLPLDQKNPAKKVLQLLCYHMGRVMAYASLGLVFGIAGRGLFLAGFQQNLSIIMGVMMILFVLIPERIMAQYNFSKPVFQIISKVKAALGAQFKKKSYRALFTIGVLNGFLPCGLIYVALFGAIAMQQVTLSVSYMVLYGLGTIPMMSAVVYITNGMTLPVRNTIQKLIPLMAVGIGTVFILRGLGLDIPFLSPANTHLFVQSTPHCK